MFAPLSSHNPWQQSHTTAAATRDTPTSADRSALPLRIRPGSTPVRNLATRTFSDMANGLTMDRTQDSAPHSYSGSTSRSPKWWRIHLFRGMISDIRRRAPFYWSDWKDALDYRVVPATIYMYFAKYD